MAFRTYLDDLWEFQIRGDGRAPLELRNVSCELRVFKETRASGSASFSIGNTKVVAAIYGPHEVRSTQKRLYNPDKVNINCEYSSACFSQNERRGTTKSDRKSIEVSKNLKDLLENIIVTDALTPGTVLDAYIELIQDDGGSYSACINALTLALADAKIPIRDYVVACTATIANSVPMVDINAQERGTSPELTVAIMAKTNKIVLLEHANLMPSMYLKDVLHEGIVGCQKMYKFVEEAVRVQSAIVVET